MGVQLFTNGASSTLSGTLSQGGTTMTLAAGTGSKFPNITGSDFFLVTLFTKDVGGVEQNIEVVKVTARVGDTLTIVRDFENITGQSGGFAYDGTATTVFVHLRWTAASAGGMLQKSGNLSGLADAAVARANLGLGNVNNTSDANKPISAAQQTALDAKAPVNNAALTGNTTVESINGGATSGFRNKIINGCMRISKRGSGAAILGGNLLGADGVITVIGGWSAITGSISTEQQIAPTRTSSGSTHYVTINTASGSTGYIQIFGRIEAADSAELANKPVTVSVRVTAGTKQIDRCYMRVYKANSANNFGAQTLVSHGADYGVITASSTIDYSHTFTCAGADAVTGLQIDVVVEYQSAVSGTFDVIFADLQCCAGSQRMPFELRPIAIEEQLRSRYYQKQSVRVNTSSNWTCFPIGMVRTPTITGGGSGFTSTGTTADTLMCYQTTAAAQTLILDAEL